MLASFALGVPEGCGFKAHTIVANSSGYAAKVMNQGPRSAFALPVRIGVYEDETGINIAFVNPVSINRTVLGDGVLQELSLASMKALSGLITSSVKGEAVDEQIGQVRSKGRVGGMGGGDFIKKIEEIYSTAYTKEALDETAQKVRDGITSNDMGWKLVYTLTLKDNDAVIYGVSRTKTEAKSFEIAGEKRSSKSYRCPGLDHASSFPIEVVVYKEGDAVKAVTLDEMYRMKLYFEDAGNWAFMKNMTMPGRIEGEIVEMSGSKLK